MAIARGARVSVAHSNKNGPAGSMAIGVCTHNASVRILPLLRALASMDRVGGRVSRVVIVENASTDDTADVVRAFVRAHPAAGIELLHEPKPGKTNAMVRLFEATGEPIVGMLDDDMSPGAGWARAILGVFDDEARAGAVGTPIRIEWASGPTRLARIYRRSLGDQLLGEARHRLEGPGAFFGGASLALRRAAYEDSRWAHGRVLDCRRGAVHESGEDAELCIRVARAGWELWYEPAADTATIIDASKQTRAHLAKLRGSIAASEPVLRWIAGTVGVEEARRELARGERLALKTALFDWRPTRRAIRLAERRGRVRGWRRVLELAHGRS